MQDQPTRSARPFLAVLCGEYKITAGVPGWPTIDLVGAGTAAYRYTDEAGVYAISFFAVLCFMDMQAELAASHLTCSVEVPGVAFVENFVNAPLGPRDTRWSWYVARITVTGNSIEDGVGWATIKVNGDEVARLPFYVDG